MTKKFWFRKNIIRPMVVWLRAGLDWWHRYDHKWGWRWRVLNFSLAALLLIAGVALPLISMILTNRSYELTPAAKQLVGTADQTLLEQLKWDNNSGAWTYNVTVPAGTPAPVAAMFRAQTGSSSSGGPYSLTIYQDPKKGVEYTDTNTGLSFSLLMESGARPGRLVDGHLVFPMSGGRQAIYTLHSTGLKEDVYLPGPSQQELAVNYRLKLPKTLQAKALTDGSGSIGIYSADPALFTADYANGKDAAVIEKAQEDGDKANLLFVLPKPFVKVPDGKVPAAITARYEFHDDQLVAIADGLKDLAGPASLDPTVTFTSASDFATNGNNEGMVSYDSTNDQVKRGGLTGGSLVTSVASTPSPPAIASIGTAGTGTSISIPPPSGVANGSLVVAYVWGERSNTTTFTITGPSGWTSYTQQNYSANSHRWVFSWWYHYATGTETSNYAFTASGVTFTAAGGYAMRITGGPTSGSPFADSVHYTTTTTANASTSVTGWTTGGDANLLLAGKTSSTSTISSLPSGWTNDATSTITTVAHTTQTTAAATGTLTFTDAASATRGIVVVTIRAPVGVGTAWQSTTSFTTGRSSHRSVVYNGRLYVYGGYDGSNYLSDIQYATINSNGTLGGTWTTATNLPTNGRNYEGFVAYNGYLYVFGGYGTTYYNDVQYAPINTDGSLGTWQTTTSFTQSRRAFGYAVYNGYLYVYGGYHATSDTGCNPTASYRCTDVQYAPVKADGSVGTWTTSSARLPSIRDDMSSFAYNGYLYAIGGDNSADMADAIYAPINANGSTGSWITTTSLPLASSGNDTTTYNGYVYMISGSGNGSQTLYAAINANGSLGSWQTSTSLPQARASGAAASYNGYIYILGGSDGGGTRHNDVQYAQISPAGTPAGFSNTATSFTTARAGACTVAYNGYLYVMGGSTDDTGYNNTNIVQYTSLNPITGQTGTWTTSSVTLPATLGFFGCAAYNGHIYIAAGQTGTGTTSINGNSYYIAVNTDGSLAASWTSLGLPYSVGTGAALFVYTDPNDGNTYLFMVGGNYGGSAIGWSEIDPTTGALDGWDAQGNVVPSSNDYGFRGYALVGKYLYAFGGVDGSDVDTTTVSYVSLVNYSDSGTTTGLNTAVVTMGAAGNGCIYAVGGFAGDYDYDGLTNAVQFACPNTNGTISQWYTTNSLTAVRGDAPAVAYNGYLYIAGGVTTGGTTVNTVQFSALNNGGSGAVSNWQYGTSLPTGKTDIAGTSYNGYLYMVGGAGSSSYQDTDYAPINADGSIGSWSAAASLNDPRQGASTVAYNGYLYALGGQLANRDPIDSVEYAPIHADGSLGVWQNTTNLTDARYRFGAVAYNGYMYVLGGGYDWNNGYNYSDVEYAPINSDGSIGAWHGSTSLTAARSDFGAVAYNGYMYVLGGLDNGGNLKNNVEYAPINGDGSLGSWSETSGLIGAVGSLNAFGYDGYLYSVGGDLENTSYSNVQYASINADGSIGPWAPTAAFSTNRGAFAATIYNGFMYIYGGWSGYDDDDVQYALLNSIARTGHYSKLVDLGSVVSVTGISYNGTAQNSLMPGTSPISYRLVDGGGNFGSQTNANTVQGSATTCVASLAGFTRYVELYISLDDSASGQFADSVGGNATVTDVSINYQPSVHPLPNVRLRGGQTLQTGLASPLDTCIDTTAPQTAPTVASVGQDNGNGSAAVPSGVTSGSLVVLAVGGEWHTSTAATCSAVSAAGFSCASVINNISGGWEESAFLLYKYATGSDTGNYSVTFNNVGGVAYDERGVVALRITGGPTSGNPFVDSFQSGTGGSSTATVSSFTPTADNSLLLASFWAADQPAGTATIPGVWTKDSTASGDGGKLTAAHLAQTTAAATGSLSFTVSGASQPVVLIGTIRPGS